MKRRMFVDGYNVIRSSGLYDHMEGEDYSGLESGLNAMRESLISDVAALALGTFQEVTVVFDGAGNAHSAGGKTRFGGVDVIFSRAGQSADSVIEKLVHEVRDSGDEVVVVTSDALVQWTVLGDNVSRMSSTNFADEIRRMKSIDAGDHDLLVGSPKNTLGERIDPKVAAKLAQFARGNRK